MGKDMIGDYGVLLAEIKARVKSAQYAALRAVNKELVGLYWDIGRIIMKRQRGETWGRSIVEHLASDLRQEFPGIQGISSRNIWRMRNLYLEYGQNAILPPLVAEIGWAHNIVILEARLGASERDFYLRMTAKFGWTKAVLVNNIEARTYQKYLANQTNFDAAVPEKVRAPAQVALLLEEGLGGGRDLQGGRKNGE